MQGLPNNIRWFNIYKPYSQNCEIPIALGFIKWYNKYAIISA